MMRVELHNNTLLMRLDGRFVDEVANETRLLIGRCKYPIRLVVDLSEVTRVDGIGENVLLWLALLGADFVAESNYATDLCKRLHLPLTTEWGNSVHARA